MRRRVIAAALFASIGSVQGAPGAPVSIPAELDAILAQHVGKWRSEGTVVTGGVSMPAKATWDCERAVGGAGVVCSWEHEWSDGRKDKALELIGYDPMSGKLTWARVTDHGLIRITANDVRGNMIYTRWESTQDGKALVGVNEVFVNPGADWTQKMTILVDGKPTTEMNLTHHRVR